MEPQNNFQPNQPEQSAAPVPPVPEHKTPPAPAPRPDVGPIKLGVHKNTGFKVATIILAILLVAAIGFILILVIPGLNPFKTKEQSSNDDTSTVVADDKNTEEKAESMDDAAKYLAENLVAKYIKYDHYNSQMDTETFLALAKNDIHNEKYMAHVAINDFSTRDFRKSAAPSFFENGQGYDYDNLTVGEEKADWISFAEVQKKVHSLFGDTYNLQKQNYVLGCTVVMIYREGGHVGDDRFLVSNGSGCGGIGTNSPVFVINDIKSLDGQKMQIDISFADIFYGPGPDGWKISDVNSEGTLVEKYKQASPENPVEEAKKYLSEHKQDFGTYTMTFSRQNDGYILESISKN